MHAPTLTYNLLPTAGKLSFHWTYILSLIVAQEVKHLMHVIIDCQNLLVCR